MGVPRSLLKQLPDLHEIWIVTPGGDEIRLSPTSIQLPIRKLAERLADEIGSDAAI